LDSHQAEIVEAIKLGAEGYVGKPINREELLNEVRRVLAE
jgi:DNA-binding NarL/FixJ family response regulator